MCAISLYINKTLTIFIYTQITSIYQFDLGVII